MSESQWQNCRLVLKDIQRITDKIANNVSVAIADGENRVDLASTISQCTNLSHTYNALGLIGFRVYFSVLAKTISASSVKPTDQNRELLLESIFLIKSAITESARSEFEPFEHILTAIKLFIPITNLKADPSIFIMSMVHTRFTISDTYKENHKTGQPLIKIKDSLKPFVDAKTLKNDDLKVIFKSCSELRKHDLSLLQINYLLATQLLISQISQGKIELDTDKFSALNLAITIGMDTSTPVSRPAVKKIVALILWVGIKTEHSKSFAKEFALSPLINSRCKEMEITIDPPIMCTISGDLRDQIEINIERLEYWSTRFNDNEHAYEYFEDTLNQIIKVCIFTGIPGDLMPVIELNPDNEKASEILETVKLWFTLITKGIEKNYFDNSNVYLSNARISLISESVSSLNYVQKILFNNSPNDLTRSISILVEIYKALTFLNIPQAKAFCRQLALFAHQVQKESIDDNELTNIHKDCDTLIIYLNSQYLEDNSIELGKPICESTLSNIPLHTTHSSSNFRQYVKRISRRMIDPSEKTIHKLNSILRVFKDLADKSHHNQIDKCMEQNDSLLLKVQTESSTIIEINNDVLNLLSLFVSNKLELPCDLKSIKAGSSREDKSPPITINTTPTLPKTIPDELVKLFTQERNDRFKAVNHAIINNIPGNLFREVHSLAGIHKQVNLSAISEKFKVIEALLSDEKSITDSIIKCLISAFAYTEIDSIPPKLITLTSISQNLASPVIALSNVISEQDADSDVLILFAEEALEICHGMRAQIVNSKPKITTLLRFIHTIKGSSAMAGLNDVSQQAHTLEDTIASNDNKFTDIVAISISEFLDSVEEFCDPLVTDEIIISSGVQSSTSKQLSEKVAASQFSPSTSKDTILLSNALTMDTNFDNQNLHNTVNVSVDVLSKMLRDIAEIQNGVNYSAGQLIKSIKRSKETGSLFDLIGKDVDNIENTVSNRMNTDDDLIATDFELHIKSVQESSRLGKSLAVSTKEGTHSAIKTLDQVMKTVRTAAGSINQALELPLNDITKRIHTVCQKCIKDTGIDVELVINGGEITVSRSIARDTQAIIEHMLRNCFAHAFIKSAQGNQVSISFEKSALGISINFTDNGKGIDLALVKFKGVQVGLISEDCTNDEDILPLIFHPGLSTNTSIDNLSGRGVGMDVVHDTIRRRNGSIKVTTKPNHGTTFKFEVPVSIRSMKALIIGSGNLKLAIPLSSIIHTQSSNSKSVQNTVRNNDITYRVIKLSDIIDDATSKNSARTIIYLKEKLNGMPICISAGVVHSVKAITPIESIVRLQGVLGYFNLIDGSIASIIDPINLLGSRIEIVGNGYRVIEINKFKNKSRKVLVVDDSSAARAKLEKVYQSHGFIVDLANNGQEALQLASNHQYSLISSDVEMPFTNGFDFIQALNSNSMHLDTPTILVTSRTSDRHRAIASKLGVDIFISKSNISHGVGKAIQALEEAGRL